MKGFGGRVLGRQMERADAVPTLDLEQAWASSQLGDGADRIKTCRLNAGGAKSYEGR